MIKKILVTGGAGFIGSNFIKYILKQQSDIEIYNLDALTYAGNLDNLIEVKDHKNYNFILGRIEDSETVNKIIRENSIEGIINFAAESHVDRSIMDAHPFVTTNIAGTLTLLEAARDNNIKRYLQISTDEVYGSLKAGGFFTEKTAIDPKSPYSASKASADHLVMSFINTYDLDAVITRCSNNYGPNQFPEKLIPLMILNALDDKTLPIYGDGLNIRDWIHVEDHCKAICKVFTDGKTGEVYNVGGNSERTNIEIVKSILDILNKPDSLIQFVKDRPGHDRRYAIDSSKIEEELGWQRKVTLEEGLKTTIDWYVNNLDWCNNIRSGEYLNYYKKQYGE